MSNQNKSTDPFEEFRKKKEEDKPGEEESDTGSENDLPEPSPPEGDDEDVIGLLKEASEREEGPEGFWSHQFQVELEEEEKEQLKEEKPGEVTSHKLPPDEQEEIDEAAREESERPDGFQSHRWDVDEESGETE